MNPRSWARSSGRSASSTPWIRHSATVPGRRPASARSRLVLPDPFAPITPNQLPWLTVIDTLSTASVRWRKTFISRSSMALALIAAATSSGRPA
jgi:hypothetical protein